MEAPGSAPPRRHVYGTPWPAYALACSADQAAEHRLAVGSCIDGDSNQIQVVGLSDGAGAMELKAEAPHPLAPTKLGWRPAPPGADSGADFDLLASVSTALELWRYEEGRLERSAKLSSAKGHRSLAPLTSFDWSQANPQKLCTSSVDTTCTIWNLEVEKIESQLIAHDKAVYDIAFSHAETHFASVGADGSVRLFDQRNLEHSTIIYEASPLSPLLRLAWNKLNPNHIAVLAMDCPGVVLIDLRRPSMALAGLSHLDSSVNSICWAPHSRNHLLAGSGSGHALIWDVCEAPAAPLAPGAAAEGCPERAPLVAYNCGHEVYQAHWPAAQPDFVALGTAGQTMVMQI
ncbi:unnamed protein product [Prorocentrum cordatum]|uniref:Peroxin-7 n=1 Tax=Prorocentrum cordatum TaxID=2364126 RepID=A0ABN9TCP0_9DINO|nr:unnamed protein product [Polarella glacialis]